MVFLRLCRSWLPSKAGVATICETCQSCYGLSPALSLLTALKGGCSNQLWNLPKLLWSFSGFVASDCSQRRVYQQAMKLAKAAMVFLRLCRFWLLSKEGVPTSCETCQSCYGLCPALSLLPALKGGCTNKLWNLPKLLWSFSGFVASDCSQRRVYQQAVKLAKAAMVFLRLCRFWLP